MTQLIPVLQINIVSSSALRAQLTSQFPLPNSKS